MQRALIALLLAPLLLAPTAAAQESPDDDDDGPFWDETTEFVCYLVYDNGTLTEVCECLFDHQEDNSTAEQEDYNQSQEMDDAQQIWNDTDAYASEAVILVDSVVSDPDNTSSAMQRFLNATGSFIGGLFQKATDMASSLLASIFGAAGDGVEYGVSVVQQVGNVSQEAIQESANFTSNTTEQSASLFQGAIDSAVALASDAVGGVASVVEAAASYAAAMAAMVAAVVSSIFDDVPLPQAPGLSQDSLGVDGLSDQLTTVTDLVD